MRNKSIFLMAVLASLFSIAAQASHGVPGYYRGNGTYVAPHQSMDPYEGRSSGYSYSHNQLVPYGQYY